VFWKDVTYLKDTSLPQSTDGTAAVLLHKPSSQVIRPAGPTDERET